MDYHNTHNPKELVSVIIPCYNHGAYIDETIISITEQSHKQIEIIVVDDGSNQHSTIAKLKHLSKSKVAKVIHTKNNGPASARNVGFNYAKGNYLLLIDADDTIDSTFIEKSINVLDNYPLIAAVSSWALCYGFEDFIWYPQGGTVSDFLFTNACPSCALIRKKAWLDSGGFNESFHIGYEDWDFWIRVTKKGWIIYIIPEILYYYLQKEKSRVRDSSNNFEMLFEDIKRNHIELYETSKFTV